MTITAAVILDSIAPNGVRLTTFELTYPRFIHAELMTHRVFCLAGDSELEFDLPAGNHGGGKRVYRMRLDEFVDKWNNGARRVGSKPKIQYDLSWVDDEGVYSANEVASRFGMRSASNINGMCRDGSMSAFKQAGVWWMKGRDIRAWRTSVPDENRYDMRARLGAMKIRQLNEETGDVQTSHVVGATYSGKKQTFRVTAGDFHVTGSADHLVFMAEGWKAISEISAGDYLVARRFGKHDDERLDPLRLKKVDGKWRSTWQSQERARLVSEDPLCRRCRNNPGEEVHHVVPVYKDPSLAFDKTNITLLCDACHDVQHKTQDWQGGTYLYGALVRVESVEPAGEQDTFDLSISGRFPNFLANGVVVHNSRNAASSRAIPTRKKIERIRQDMARPNEWGLDKKGMQPDQVLSPEEQKLAEEIWTEAGSIALMHASRLDELKVHKQVANRILEPFDHITVVLSTTKLENHFALRLATDPVTGRPLPDPNYFELATKWKAARDAATPTPIALGEWHLPYVTQADWESLPGFVDYESCKLNQNYQETLKMVSAARCARVSYMRQGQGDVAENKALHDRLVSGGHWAPLEHVATPIGGFDFGEAPAMGLECMGCDRPLKGRTVELHGSVAGTIRATLCMTCGIGHVTSGNFHGWRQYRKEFANEAGGD